MTTASASAAQLYTDKSSFQSDAGDFLSIESFESFSSGSSITFPDFILSSDGDPFTIESVNVTDGLQSIRMEDPGSNGSTMTFQFSSPVNAFGIDIFDALDFGTSGSLSLLTDNGDSLTCLVAPQPGGSALRFCGLVDDTSTFNTLTILSTQTGDGLQLDFAQYGLIVFGPQAILDGEPVNPLLSGGSVVTNTSQATAFYVSPIISALGSRTFYTFRAGKPDVGRLEPFQNREKRGKKRDTSMYEEQIGLNAGDSIVLLGVWGGYSYTELDNDFSRTRYDGQRDMFLGGIDYSPSENVIVGIALGYENSNIDTKFNNGDADSDGWTIAPYLGLVLNDVWNLDVNFGWSDIDTDQDRAFGLITSDVDTERSFASVSLTGYTELDNWALVGRFGALYAESEDDDYTESDGTFVDSRTNRVTQVFIGGEATYPMGDFEPFVGATYSNDVNYDKLELTAGKQPDNDDDDLLINAGFRYYQNESLSIMLDYGKRFGRSDYDEDTISFNLRWDF
jgi:hypothetical protein